MRQIVIGLLMFAVALPAAAVTMPPLHFDRAAETVVVSSGGVRLVGALFTPAGAGPFPAAVLVHGSGLAMHDDPAFIVHANAFLARGFAVFTYDKRGSGASGGDLDMADYDDLAHDVAAVVGWLRTRNEIRPEEIGLVGRSEGGWVAPLAASADPRLAFVVMSSGSAESPRQQVDFWTLTALRQSGADAATIARVQQVKEALREFYRRVADGTLKVADSGAELRRLDQQVHAFARFQPEMPDAVMNPAIEPVAKFRAFTRMLDYDPMPALLRMKAPLLAYLGAEDAVVNPASNAKILETLRARGRDVTVHVLPGVDHTLLVMDGDRIVGYATGYLEGMTDWAHERVLGRRSRSQEGAAH